MFKGFNQILQKPKGLGDEASEPKIFPIYAADVLLSSENRIKHIETIKTLLNLPGKLYDLLYYKPIARFAEFVQNLPQTQHGAYSHEGGFLDHALERAARALSLCLNYFFPQEKSFQLIGSQEALWIYAVFTAALVLDIGKLAVKYDVSVCHKDGRIVRRWTPYQDAMLQYGTHYQFEFVKENRDNLGWLVTALLARQILTDPEAGETGDAGSGGFNWIASDPNVLEAWLRMLSGESRPISSFMSMIPLADAQLMEQFLNLRKGQFAGTTPTGLFSGTMPVTPTDKTFNTQAGEAFLRWLRAGLADGTISVNEPNSSVNVVREGVLLSSEVFKTFLASTTKYNTNYTPEGVEAEFGKLMELYTAPMAGAGKYVNLKGALSSVTQSRFLLVANPHLLFAMGQVVPPANMDMVRTQVPFTPEKIAAAQMAKTNQSHTKTIK